GTGDYETHGPRGGAGRSGSGARGQSSWPSGEDNGGWPTGQQPAVSGSDQAPSWSGGGPRPDRPAGATGSWRGGAPPPPAQPPRGQRRSAEPAYGNDQAYGSEPAYGNGPGYESGPGYGSDGPAYGGEPDWAPDDGEGGWPGSDDALEPLPSSQTHRGSGGPQDGSRRRWRAPEDDDPDERNAW
ncbi:MAG TPA: hypothetical protein VHU92_11770, partial [Streptosporangiaceae bacterium]|nr:hypothetical protein [Streptosporangiaceae bacterium]